MEPAGPETASVAVPARALTEKSPMEEYYQSCSGGKRHEGGRGEGPGSHVTLEPPKLMFHPGSTSLPVAITNHTKGKLRYYTLPGCPTGKAQSQPHQGQKRNKVVFCSVFPACCGPLLQTHPSLLHRHHVTWEP